MYFVFKWLMVGIIVVFRVYWIHWKSNHFSEITTIFSMTELNPLQQLVIEI